VASLLYKNLGGSRF